LGSPFAEVFLMGLQDNDDFNQALLDAVYKRALANVALVDFTKADGSVVPLALTVSYLLEDGGPGGVVAVFDDITELSELRAKERELNEQLRAAALESDARNKELESALKSRQRIRTMAMALVLVLFLGLGLFSWFSTPLGTVATEAVSSIAGGKGRSGAKALQTIAVAPSPVSNTISLSGKLEPLEEVIVLCPFQGKVAKKNFFYGEKVERGQVLLELDTSDQEIKLREARSKFIKTLQEYKRLKDWESGAEMAKARRGLSKAQYDLQRSQAKLEENKILYEQGIIPKTDLDQAKDELLNSKSSLHSAQEELESVKEKGDHDNLSIARMELENSRNQLESLEGKLAQSNIKAPVEGILIRPSGEDKKEAKAIEVGAPLNEGDILLAVGNLEGMTVQAKVDEVDISKVALNQKVKVTGDAFPDVVLEGYINHISSQAKAEGGSSAPTFEVIVTIENLPDEVQDAVRLGMTAHLRIVVYENPEALMVPINAVERSGGRKVLRVRDPNTGETKKVEVDTGLTTLDSVEITSGLVPGDHVVISGGPM
jgi:multidrug efflux pump subunit AcrA (membrane-fusion protein)